MTKPRFKIWIPVTLFTLLVVSGLTLSRSTIGQRMMLNTGVDILENKTGYRLNAEGVAGTWPWHIVLTNIKLEDGDNDVATISELDLRWSPLPALTGAIRIKSLSLGEVRINIRKGGMEGTEAPALIPTLDALPDLEIRDITVTSLTLINSDGVASDAFILSGQSETAPGRVDVEVAFLPHDASKTNDQATFELEYDRDQDHFSLSTNIYLDKNGILTRLGEERIPVPISLSTTSTGPASSWQARSTFVAGDLGGGTLVLSCDCLAGKNVSISGTFDPKGINLSYLPFSTSQPFTFASNLSYDGETRRLQVKDMDLETSGATMKADLEISVTDQTYHLSGEGLLTTRDGILAESGLSPLFWTIEDLHQDETKWTIENARLETLKGFVDATKVGITPDGNFTSDLNGELDVSDLFAEQNMVSDLGKSSWSAHIDLSNDGMLDITELQATTAEDAVQLAGEVRYVMEEGLLSAELEVSAASAFQTGELSIPAGPLLDANVSLNHAVAASDLNVEATLGPFAWRSFKAPPSRIIVRLEDWSSGRVEDLKGSARLEARGKSPDISSLSAHLAFRLDTNPSCTINGALSANGNYAGSFALCLNSRREADASVWNGLLTASNFHGGPVSGARASLSLSQGKTDEGYYWEGQVGSEDLTISSVTVGKLDTVISLHERIDGPEMTINSARILHQDTVYSLQNPVTFSTKTPTLGPITILSDEEGFLTLRNLDASTKFSASIEADNFKLPVTPTLMSGEAMLEATPQHQVGYFDLHLEPQTQARGKVSFDLDGKWDGTHIDGTAHIALVEPGKEPEIRQISEFQMPLEAQFGERTTLVRSGPASASLVYDGSIARLLAFVPVYDHAITGMLNVNASLRAEEGKALWRGQAVLENGSYTHEGQSLHVEGVEISTDLQGIGRTFEGTIDITQRDPENGKTTLEGTGEFSLQSFQKWQGSLDLHLDENSLLQHPNYFGILSGDLSLTANPERALLEGRIRASRVDGSIPPPSGIDIVELNVIPVDKSGNPVAAPTRDQGTILLPRLELDVKLEADDQVFIRGRGVDSEWSAKLTLTGSSDQPLLDGALAIRRGHLMFGGRRFEFESGAVAMNGAQYGDPYVNLVARYKVDSAIEARIVVEGQASAPTVRFASTPPLPEEEIVSYVLFGKPVIELGPVEALRTTVALAQTSGRAGFGTSLFDVTRRAIGVDVLQFTPPGGTNEQGSSLTVGKYVASGVFLSITEEFGTQTRSAGVEIKVTNSISIGAKVSDAAETAATVEWRRDY